MENQKLELDVKPKPNCKWCYGRGYTGIDAKTKREITCPCIIKQLQKSAKKAKIQFIPNLNP